MWKQARRGVARLCLMAWGGRAIILAEEEVARTCFKARDGRAIFLVGCTIFVDGKFVEGFGGGFSLAVLWGFFEE